MEADLAAQIPAWFQNSLPEPSMPASLATKEGADEVSESVYQETLKNHRILEQFQGLDSKWVLDLIRLTCDRATAEFQKKTSRLENHKMNSWMELVSSVVDIESYGLDNPIRLACESGFFLASHFVLNFCQYIRFLNRGVACSHNPSSHSHTLRPTHGRKCSSVGGLQCWLPCLPRWLATPFAASRRR